MTARLIELVAHLVIHRTRIPIKTWNKSDICSRRRCSKQGMSCTDKPQRVRSGSRTEAGDDCAGDVQVINATHPITHTFLQPEGFQSADASLFSIRRAASACRCGCSGFSCECRRLNHLLTHKPVLPPSVEFSHHGNAKR